LIRLIARSLIVVILPGATAQAVTFPMSLLDNDDGRLAFKLEVFARSTGGGSGKVDDMPNPGIPAGVTR